MNSEAIIETEPSRRYPKRERKPVQRFVIDCTKLVDDYASDDYDSDEPDTDDASISTESDEEEIIEDEEDVEDDFIEGELLVQTKEGSVKRAREVEGVKSKKAKLLYEHEIDEDYEVSRFSESEDEETGAVDSDAEESEVMSESVMSEEEESEASKEEKEEEEESDDDSKVPGSE